MFTGRIFMAITLEFVLHFTGAKSRKFIRGVQIGVLLVPFVYFIRLILVYQILSVASEVLFCALVVVLAISRVAARSERGRGYAVAVLSGGYGGLGEHRA